MPQFLSFLYPNFASSAYQTEFVLLSRILLLQPILLGLSGVLASVTQVHRRFTLFALSPVLYNLGIILGAAALYPLWGLPGIGLGVILGAIAYLAVNIPVVVGAGVLPRLRLPTLALMTPIIRDSVPRSLALGVGSVTVLALTAIASRIGTGAVSVFTFASNLEAGSACAHRLFLRRRGIPGALRSVGSPKSAANSLASSPQAPAISSLVTPSLSDSSSFCGRISYALFSVPVRLTGTRRALPRLS